MDYITNCTRVPFSQATTPGKPEGNGLAPANFLDLDSDPVSFETYDEAALN